MTLLKLYLDRYIAHADTKQTTPSFSNIWGKLDEIEFKGITTINVIREVARKTEGRDSQGMR
jgi:hypothetical protein